MMNAELAEADECVECVVGSVEDVPEDLIPRNYLYSSHEVDEEMGEVKNEPVSAVRAKGENVFGTAVSFLGIKAARMQDGTFQLWNVVPTQPDASGHVPMDAATVKPCALKCPSISALGFASGW